MNSPNTRRRAELLRSALEAAIVTGLAIWLGVTLATHI
jgi:uncharacterized membrane-anchored protein YjiN (DUF445 family)